MVKSYRYIEEKNRCSSLTIASRVNFCEIPALLKRTLSPADPTFSLTKAPYKINKIIKILAAYKSISFQDKYYLEKTKKTIADYAMSSFVIYEFFVHVFFTSLRF
ncbi:hypothetical protein V1478_001143 [Vespula squamosa]|uniref:Uncharacterized protein n=1 Tax=Vespula squamosa TaxID=30214 RepID=A0ABD2C7I6_VESSQ